MALKDDLNSRVVQILGERWKERQGGNKVPEPDDLGLGNEAITLDATVLYADLDDSTKLVDNNSPKFAAQMYKSYLWCAARIIQEEHGEITAYDGDRIMAVYTGNLKNTNAVRTALKINWAVNNIINPAIKNQYPRSTYSVKQVVGIDTSSLFVAREGVRGDNDLVWVGRAANYAAKLSGRNGNPTQITEAVHVQLPQGLKSYSNGQNLWSWEIAPETGNKMIYTTSAWMEM